MLMLRATGLCLIALGILWALQGAGLLGWSADRFMLEQGAWVLRGLAVVAFGVTIMGLSATVNASDGSP